MAVSGEISIDATLNGHLTISEKVKIEANKNVTPSNSQQVVIPDENYDALAKVTVGAVSLQNKTVTPSASQQTVTADSGYNGLGSVTVNAAASDPSNLTFSADSSDTVFAFDRLDMTVTIDDTVGNGVDIAARAFKDCYFVGNVICGNNVDYLYGLAFTGCKKLRNARFPAVTYFEPSTFSGCQNLKNLYLGYNGVVEIGMGSGDICQGHNGNVEWDDSGTLYVHVPGNQLTNYQNNVGWQTAIASATSAGYTLTLVGDYA